MQKTLPEHLTSQRRKVMAHKTSLTPTLLIELKCLYQASNVSAHVFVC